MTATPPDIGSRSGCNGHQGFTLVELLVGLTLLTILALVLYSGFWLGMRSWQAAAARHKETEDVRVTVNFLASYLSKAYPLLRLEDNQQRLQFGGEEHRLRFVTDMAPHLGIAGLYTVVLELVDNGGERQLIATRTLLHPDLEPSDIESGRLAQRAVLVRELREARLAYFGMPANNGSSPSQNSGQWQDEWPDDAQHLPTMVSLTVTPNAGKPWPTLVLRLRIDGTRRDASNSASQEPFESESSSQPGESAVSRPMAEKLSPK